MASALSALVHGESSNQADRNREVGGRAAGDCVGRVCAWHLTNYERVVADDAAVRSCLNEAAGGAGQMAPAWPKASLALVLAGATEGCIQLDRNRLLSPPLVDQLVQALLRVHRRPKLPSREGMFQRAGRTERRLGPRGLVLAPCVLGVDQGCLEVAVLDMRVI